MKKSEEAMSLSASTKKVTSKSDTANGSFTKKTKEQKRIEAEARNKLYSVSKPVKDKVHKLEKSIKLQEDKLKEIESRMAAKDFYADTENVKKVTTEFKEAKDKLNNLYHEWMEQTKKLSKLEEQLK
jgi:ATP-binding cassette subfamily F protein 3